MDAPARLSARFPTRISSPGRKTRPKSLVTTRRDRVLKGKGWGSLCHPPDPGPASPWPRLTGDAQHGPLGGVQNGAALDLPLGPLVFGQVPGQRVPRRRRYRPRPLAEVLLVGEIGGGRHGASVGHVAGALHGETDRQTEGAWGAARDAGLLAAPAVSRPVWRGEASHGKRRVEGGGTSLTIAVHLAEQRGEGCVCGAPRVVLQKIAGP